jgi:hypothetical protein
MARHGKARPGMAGHGFYLSRTMASPKEPELRCSRELALLLGAVQPRSIVEHRELKRAGYLLIRDALGVPMFWQWQVQERLTAGAKSS